MENSKEYIKLIDNNKIFNHNEIEDLKHLCKNEDIVLYLYNKDILNTKKFKYLYDHGHKDINKYFSIFIKDNKKKL